MIFLDLVILTWCKALGNLKEVLFKKVLKKELFQFNYKVDYQLNIDNFSVNMLLYTTLMLT